MMTRKIVIVGLSFLPLVSELAFSAPKKSSPSSFSSESSSKPKDRSFYFGLPLIAERSQLRPHIEVNLGDEASLALEGAMLGETEELSEKETTDTGNSLKVKGAEATLLLSRYSEPTTLGGFFWSLGAGYRQYTAEWKKKPSDQEQSLRLESADEEGYLHHKVEGRGTTGHVRVGYRYVADQWPVAIGGHVGVRHMTSSVKSLDEEENEKNETGLEYSAVTKEEEKSLRNKMMTTPDVALEFGVIF